MKPLHRSAVLLCLAALPPATAFAGPLSPPAGPVAPTHKTLTQVEPRTPLSPQTTPGDESSVFRITQPGTYYLAADITVPAGKNGITITAADVTIDLGGFMIRGEAGSLAGVAAVEADRLALRRGRISGLGGHGVSALAAPDGRLEDVLVLGCGGSGFVLGDGATADRCTAKGCADHGFSLETGSILRDCIAAGNTDAGIRMPGRSQALRCTARENGVTGIAASGHGNVIRECTVLDNDYGGIHLSGTGALVVGNYCSGHAAPWGGIITAVGSADNAVIGNATIGNGGVTYGVHALGEGNLVARNWAAGGCFHSILNTNAAGPTVNAAALPTNTNPDANYQY